MLYHIAQFLREDLKVSEEMIPTILHYCGKSPNRLPVVLWQYRLIDLTQLDLLCDWLDRHVNGPCDPQAANNLTSGDQPSCLSVAA
jgi:hypothetical protein